MFEGFVQVTRVFPGFSAPFRLHRFTALIVKALDAGGVVGGVVDLHPELVCFFVTMFFVDGAFHRGDRLRVQLFFHVQPGKVEQAVE